MDNDHQAFEFAYALYLARQVDREAAQLIVQAAEAGEISIVQATSGLTHAGWTGSNEEYCDAWVNYWMTGENIPPFPE